MRRGRDLGVFLFASGFFLSACAPRAAADLRTMPLERVYAQGEPRDPPAAPSASGHWEYVDGRYVWVDAPAPEPKPGYVYVDGHWEARDGRYVFVPPSYRPIRPEGGGDQNAKATPP
jgi:hypothetical protein